jgi:hypothetical protein
VAYGLPVGAAARTTANGANVDSGSGRVSDDGNYYFSWIAQTGGSVTFVVTAGGVTRTFVGIF